jgi:hypothetical protein
VPYKVSRSVFFGNGYGVEFVISDPYTISFSVVTEKDPTMVEDNKVCIGTECCIREGEEESLRDFAIRAREEGLAFAEAAIVDYKESLDLSAVLGEVLDPSTG